MPELKIRRISADALEPQAPQPVLETPKQEGTDKGSLAECFEQLRHQDGITLPYQERSSPSKRRKSPGHDVVKHIQVLYFTDRESLSHALETFRLRSPSLQNIDDKLNYLLESLTIAVKSAQKTRTPLSECHCQAAPSHKPNARGHDHITTSMAPPTSASKVRRTPTSATSHWPPPSLQSTQLDNQPAPPSPTLSIKALSHKAAPKPSLDDIAKYPMLPPAMAEEPEPEVPKTVAGITSVNTSFATTANISFQFSEQQGSQEPISPASSFGGMDGANDTAKVDGTQTTCYGTPPDPEDSSMHDANTTSGFSRTQTTNYGSSDIFDMSKDEPETPTRGPKMNAPSPNDRDHSSPHKDTLQPPARVSTPPPVPLDKPKDSPQDTRRDSPGKQPGEHIRVRGIPIHGITGTLVLSYGLLKLPFRLRFECARVMEACNLTAEELEARWHEPRDFDSLRELTKRIAPLAFRCGTETAYDACSYHMNLRYADSKDKLKPLFEPELPPPGREQLTSWQRAFGCDRILFVDSDSLLNAPKRLDLSKQKVFILQRFQEMLGEPQEFLGRTWLQFHVKTKDSKRGGLADAKQHGAYGFTFVALTGDNDTLPPLTLCTVIDWALRLSENADESWCKLYARLDQRASRNTQVIVLSIDEIEKVDDDYATRDPPPTERNNKDARFEQAFKDNATYKELIVMNDGCSEAPEWTLRQCGLALGLDYVPSAVQFRCAGAKGMIFLSRTMDEDDEDADMPPPRIKIRLSKSQRKVIFEPRDKDKNKYDELFFELSAHRASHAVEHSCMYLDFIQILHVCGVPVNNMEQLVLRRTASYTRTLLEALDGPQALRKWLHEQSATMEERRRDSDISTIAGFPISKTEQAIQMLESGFEPAKFGPLARLISDEIENSKDRMIGSFKVTLEQSTMVFGVADPSGSLGPEEVHLRLSKPLYDPVTGRSISHFEGYVLLSRLPAARASDVRVVKAVYRPELSHLVDVLVVSGRGPQPLADMCSGGDYDGDTFWICKEPLLVKPFRNVPAPRELPDPSSLGIKVDKRKLCEIVPDPTSEKQVREFVRMGTANRMTQSWVGIVTKLHARVVHAKDMFHPAAIACADLKDRLMDSDKNGFSFDNEALEAFKKKWDICNLPNPAYFKYTDKKGEDGEGEKKYEDADPKNAVDKIYCETLATEFEKAADLAREKLVGNKKYDPDLTAFYECFVEESKDNAAIRSELRHLRQELRELNELFMEGMGRWRKVKGTRKANSAWTDAVLESARVYQSIQPVAKATDPVIGEWCRGNGSALTTWDRLKAAALATLYEKGRLRFSVAGSELCRMKAEASEQSRLLTKDAYLLLGPRRKRKRMDEDPVENDGDMDVDPAGDEGGAVAGAEA